MPQFDKQSVERIAKTVRWFERNKRNETPQRRRQSIATDQAVWHGLLMVDDTISARTDDTPGDGTITLQYFDGTSFQTDQTGIKVYNPYKSEIETDGTNDLAVQVAWGDGGEWWIVGVDCDQGNSDGTDGTGGDGTGGPNL